MLQLSDSQAPPSGVGWCPFCMIILSGVDSTRIPDYNIIYQGHETQGRRNAVYIITGSGLKLVGKLNSLDSSPHMSTRRLPESL